MRQCGCIKKAAVDPQSSAKSCAPSANFLPLLLSSRRLPPFTQCSVCIVSDSSSMPVFAHIGGLIFSPELNCKVVYQAGSENVSGAGKKEKCTRRNEKNTLFPSTVSRLLFCFLC